MKTSVPSAKSKETARGRKSMLSEYVNLKVSVITNDGRNVVGTMRGFDQVCNIVLEKCVQRTFSPDSGVESLPLGLYVLRGDNIAVVGEVDLEVEEALKWENVKVRFDLALSRTSIGSATTSLVSYNGL